MSNSINYNNVKAHIERKLCPEHSQHPTFTKTANGFTINACCEAFKSTLIKEAEKVIKIELEKAISQMFKNAFK